MSVAPGPVRSGGRNGQGTSLSHGMAGRQARSAGACQPVRTESDGFGQRKTRLRRADSLERQGTARGERPGKTAGMPESG